MASCDPRFDLEQAFRKGIAAAYGEAAAVGDPQVKASGDPKHGDYQCNAALAIARSAGANPREVAAKILAATPLGALGGATIAGPGFINVQLGDSALRTMLDRVAMPDLGIEPAPRPHAVVVDLCGVNVAKQMHVGHLRSTILGDVIARLHERLGRKVFRENHLGDWGLTIAMTLSALRRQKRDLNALTLADLNQAYRAAQLEAATDDAGLEAARTRGAGPHRLIELETQQEFARAAEQDAKATLLKLQAGDPATVAAWQQLIRVTMADVLDTARVLGVNLTDQHSRGESFYRDKLASTVQAFIDRGLAQEDQGAMVVRFADRERPLLIRKADGGFLYSTTDLAAIHYRVGELRGGDIIYVVDARQRDHFRDVFDAVRLIGWDKLPDGTQAKLSHLGFGSVLGTDKKPLKTRSGELFLLRTLLDEAIERGTAQVRLRAQQTDAPTQGLTEKEIAAIGRAVGIAAVKYADLSGDPVKDYVFDLDRMIAFEGDTGPYIQYAHARIASLIARSGVTEAALSKAEWKFEHPAERALALAILSFPATIKSAADQGSPQRVCAALHELANSYATFYQACPVLKAPDEATKMARLRLSHLTRRVLAEGLALLGMESPDRM
ncbi:MAG: arginine--tRNA ligase [Planctomycetes bacterium]|nr:arginine--tRNA ligase [Planctomycetota bacterium]